MIRENITRTDDGSAVEPATLAEVKNYIKENYGTDTVEDTLITDMITAARMFIENETQVALVLQDVVYWAMDEDEAIGELRLPFAPVNTITSVVRKDMEGTETELTLNSDYYSYGLENDWIRLNKTWSTGAVDRDPIYITYESGHATAAAMPKELKLACMKLVAENYVNRDSSVDWSISSVPYDVAVWIEHYKRADF
jgi:uncharacterized phiE125 gp8 family phage protein